MDPPLDRSATWPYEDGEPGRFSYVRADHPTGVACEEALGALDGEAAGRVERVVRTIVNATSLGGTRSKLEARHRWEGDRIPTGLLRLSVGLEDPEGLWADLEQALAGL